MALGKVVVNALNQLQGDVPAVEKFFLFIGIAPSQQNTVVFLNTDSDLDAELGSATSELKTNLIAARNNAGQDWNAVCVPIAQFADWEQAFDLAMDQDVRVEACVLTTPITSQAHITALQTKAEETLNALGRRLFFIATTVAIDPDTQTWAQYITAMSALTDELSCFRVSVVPQIFASAIGIYAGRLCHFSTSVADTPMRVATGPLVGVAQSDFPVDSAGKPYNNAQAKGLNDQRFSVPQIYADYPGVFWADGQMLDAPNGDYQVIENLRVVDKAARLVRLVLISLLGNRNFNSTPSGMAWATLLLMKPLLAMAKNYTFKGIPFPGEIKTPVDGDVAINWQSHTQVSVFLVARPLEIGKDITANIVLDLSAPTA